MPDKAIAPFHLAIPVHSVPEARDFYGGVLGCAEGRRDGDRWQDYNFFGHQLVCHFTTPTFKAQDYFNPVDTKNVPVPHFGLCLTVAEFRKLADRLERRVGDGKINWVIRPVLRFEGMPGEQWTMFFKDPSNNNIEFKAMTTAANLFAKYDVQVATKATATNKSTTPAKKSATATKSTLGSKKAGSAAAAGKSATLKKANGRAARSTKK
jgi:extradiol dioxygenase family protein